MTDLVETVAAALAGKTVRAALLIVADFEGGPGRYWTGPYDKTFGGVTYKGAGRLVAVDNLATPIGTSSSSTTLRLSGVDPEIAAKAVGEIDSVIGRDVSIFAQFFDEDLTPLDSPIALGGGVSDQLTFEAEGARKRSIALTLEGPFVGRSRSPASFYSYSEQWDRAVAMGYETGDDGGKFMPALQNQRVSFPQ